VGAHGMLRKFEFGADIDSLGRPGAARFDAGQGRADRRLMQLNVIGGPRRILQK
jgi:hypothetical protein